MSPIKVKEYIYEPQRCGPPAYDFCGVPVARADSVAILDFMVKVVSSRTQAVILYLNADAFNLACKLAWLKAYYNSVPLVMCDGEGIRWGLKTLGMQPPPKVTYNVFTWDIARVCCENRLRLFLLGSQAGVAQMAAQNLRSRYPGLQIAGTHHGYFARSGNDCDEVIRQINTARPDVLLVCFGMPAQEAWLMENAPRIAANAIFTGGSAIDYAAGLARMPPRWMVKHRLEWLFRFLMEPRRLFRRYTIGNFMFIARIYAAKFNRPLHRTTRPTE